MMTQIIVTSLVCFGTYKATRYTTYVEAYRKHGDVTARSEVLGFIKKYGDEHFPLWVRKPLYDCPPCMGSFWSVVTSVYFGFGVELLLIIPAVSGLNYILTRLFPYSEE